MRHLKAEQVIDRLARRLPKPRPSLGDIPAPRERAGAWQVPASRARSVVGPTRFAFLNVSTDLEEVGWEGAGVSRLWLYNLHYFDDLAADNAAERRSWHADLVRRWIAENPVGAGAGWEPYPVSLRIVNWIKAALAGFALDPAARASLAVQARWLEPRIERHLGANHLWANAKALVFAGLFFGGPEGDRWLARGGRLLAREAAEQILPDGGHYERSPMYHAILLEDVLDLVNTARAYGRAGEVPFVSLPDSVARMLAWLDAMTHPDGGPAFFNDVAFGIAPTRAALEAYAERLGIQAPAGGETVRHLAASGYVRVDIDDAAAILDVAPVGPDHQPGHAHADTLSFELSVGGERVVVNGGTSTYARDAVRTRERSTAAHSTVEIDGADSSEVWAAFRVASRARPFDVSVAAGSPAATVCASHDGYRRLPGKPVHRRTWRLEPKRLTVTDEIEGAFDRAVARFHVHPDVTPGIDDDGRSGTLVLASGRPVSWAASAPGRLDTGSWSPEFGRTVPSVTLAVPFDGPRLETVFTW